MGVIYSESGEVLRTYVDKFGDEETTSRILSAQLTEEDDKQPVKQYQLAGFRSNPEPGTKIAIIDLGDSFRISCAEHDGINHTLASGESIIYAVSSGAVVASMQFKNGGGIDIIANDDVTLTATGKNVEITATNVNITGKLNVTGNISSDADVIADAQVTAISALQHPHVGDLGYNTGPPVPVGGGVAPPASPPSATGGDLDMNGNNITNVNTVDGVDVSAHTHFVNAAPGESNAPT